MQRTGAHLVGIFFEAVFPVGMVFAFAVSQEIQNALHFAVAHHPPQTYAVHIVEGHHDFQAAGFDFEKVESFDLGADRAAADLLDYAHPMVRVNDLVSDAEALVIHEGRSTAAQSWVWGYEGDDYPHSML